MAMETCPNCNYMLARRSANCPYCGFQLTHPLWKKVGAWILLVIIAYGLVKCHLRLLDGFQAPADSTQQPSDG